MGYMSVSLPLFDAPDYRYQISLEGSSYTLRYTYNSIMKLYTLSIYDVDSVPLCCGTGVVPNYPISYSHIIKGLSGFFFLSPKSNIDNSAYQKYPDKLSTYYDLRYTYNATV